MRTINLVILLFICLVSYSQTTFFGKYTYSQEQRGRLTLKKDSTFEQFNGNCTWNYLATGKWTIISDTLILAANKLYFVSGNGNKTLKDTSDYHYKTFYTMNKYIVNYDTLQLLVYRSDKKLKIKYNLKKGT